MLSRYIEPILSACLLFPIVAGFFTMPFMIGHYRRYGGIAFMRVIVVYSFILYSMCAFLLTVLPLPSIESVRQMPSHGIGWIPFDDLYKAAVKAGFSLSHPGTLIDLSVWKAFLTSGDMFQLVANVVMLIPLGFYLRYYFRRSWKQTLLIGLGVSLFYELTQLSGLFFIYPKPYRYTEVDDLITNTLGAMIGYWITPLIAKLLPSRDEIDLISYDKGHRITVIRRFMAAIIDWLLFFMLWIGVMFLPIQMEPSMLFVASGFFGYILWVILYFGLLQWLLKGQTLGKAILKIKVVSSTDDASPPTLRQLAIRYFMIYFLTLPITMMELAMLAVLGLFSISDGVSETARLTLILVSSVTILVTLLVLFASFRKFGMFPHGHYSKTNIVLTAPRKPFRELMARRKANEKPVER